MGMTGGACANRYGMRFPPDIVWVKAGTLDDTSSLAPATNI